MLLEVAAFLLGSLLKQTATRKPKQLKPASQSEIIRLAGIDPQI
jgi:hypothetical protein